MSKHTPESILEAADAELGPFCCDEEYQRLRVIMGAAPDLLEALEGLMDNEHQSAFEHWLVAKSPSGDCESVQAQWLESSEYYDFIDLYSDEMNAIARAKGESQ